MDPRTTTSPTSTSAEALGHQIERYTGIYTIYVWFGIVQYRNTYSAVCARQRSALSHCACICGLIYIYRYTGTGMYMYRYALVCEACLSLTLSLSIPLSFTEVCDWGPTGLTMHLFHSVHRIQSPHSICYHSSCRIS